MLDLTDEDAIEAVVNSFPYDEDYWPSAAMPVVAPRPRAPIPLRDAWETLLSEDHR